MRAADSTHQQAGLISSKWHLGLTIEGGLASKAMAPGFGRRFVA
jgi:hypothetical protein